MLLSVAHITLHQHDEEFRDPVADKGMSVIGDGAEESGLAIWILGEDFEVDCFEKEQWC